MTNRDGPVAVQRDGDVAWVRLQHGKVNALDRELCDALSSTLGALEADEAVRAVVLTGNGRAFSAGVELRRVAAEDSGYTVAFLDSLSRCFETVLRFPKPTVAAIDGHAIAGGCVIAVACDVRLAAAGPARLGFTELQVGVPFPTVALEILRWRVAPEAFARLLLTAETVPVDDGPRLGLVDEVVAPENLPALAGALAARLAAVPQQTFAVTKQQLQADVRDRIEQRRDRWEPSIVDLWLSTPVRQAISAFAADRLGGSS